MLNDNDVIWKDMIGYEGQYQVSSTGLIRSIVDNHGRPAQRQRATHIRSGNYEYVNLSVKDTTRSEAVHRAVAKAFIPNPDNKPMVNHIDGNKLNNNACNLEWATCSENHKHAYAAGLRVNALGFKGKKHASASKHHNVSWDNDRCKWKATLKDQGKMVFQKRFDSEREAALYVNKMLDELGYSDRPRNIVV